MTFDFLKSTLEAYFETQWASTTSLQWENAKGKIPDDSWIRFVLRPSITQNAELGSEQNRISGFIVVQIFVQLDKGLGEAYRLADSVVSILQNKSISGIFTYAGTVNPIGNSDQQGYYQLNTLFAFDAQ